MIKKTLRIFSFLALAYGLTFFFKEKKEKSENTAKAAQGWQKVEKKKEKTSFTPAKTIDLEQHKIPTPKSRRPASKPSTALMRSGRHLEGMNTKKYTDPTQELKISNHVNPKWKKILGHNLTRFQAEGTQVLIKKERPMIYVVNGIGEYREEVLISYKLPDGRRSSYKAMINSQTGKIVYTFARQKNDDFRRKPAGLTHPLAK